MPFEAPNRQESKNVRGQVRKMALTAVLAAMPALAEAKDSDHDTYDIEELPRVEMENPTAESYQKYFQLLQERTALLADLHERVQAELADGTGTTQEQVEAMEASVQQLWLDVSNAQNMALVGSQLDEQPNDQEQLNAVAQHVLAALQVKDELTAMLDDLKQLLSNEAEV
jgi:hypothetical protein